MKIIEPGFEILTEFTGHELEHLEKVGRTCYKSEDKISEGSAEKFVRMLVGRGHEAILEHGVITVRFICDRGISHQIVRHRIASFAQESTRYCVARNMKLSTKNPHNKLTVAELYENKQNSSNGAWKRMKIKQYNEDEKVLEYAKIKDVWKTGKKECIKLTTRLGYELVCTPDHEVKVDGAYRKAGDLSIGDGIMVNGTEELYKNREWLYDQNITQNKTFVQIADETGYNLSTIKKWARKLGIPKKKRSYWNIGRRAWNKGIQDPRQVEALKKYHHCGRRKDKILKEDTVKYQKHNTGTCAVCGATEQLQVHHIDKGRTNHNPDNLITLCQSCHLRMHSHNLETAYIDTIVQIESAGEQEVYDIEMASNHHNFVANGVVVHNCSYDKGKYGGEITVIKPCFLEEGTPNYDRWYLACRNAEEQYMKMLRHGMTAEEARSVLPNSLKTEVVMTANYREWRHFFAMRCSKAAHPQIREIAIPLQKEFAKHIPVLFEDSDE